MRAAATTTCPTAPGTCCCAPSSPPSCDAPTSRPAAVTCLEFELLVKFAADSTRVVGKQELARCIWRRQHVNGRTIDSHVARLRTRLASAGAHHLLVNKWGQGWSLTTPTPG